MPRAAGTRAAAPASRVARERASRAVAITTRPRSALGTYGRPTSEDVLRTTSSQPSRSRQGPEGRAEARELLRAPLDDEAPSCRGSAEELEVDADGQDPVVAGEARGRRLRHCGTRRREGVHAPEQLLPLLPPGWVSEALRRVEGRHGELPRRVAEREVGEAREARLVRVDDVEAVARERELEARPHPQGDAEPAAARDGNGRPHRDDVLEREALADELLQRPAACGEGGRPPRRGEDDDLVPATAQRLGRARHVVVDRVRLRPRERGDHADAEAHANDSTGGLRPPRTPGWRRGTLLLVDARGAGAGRPLGPMG